MTLKRLPQFIGAIWALVLTTVATPVMAQSCQVVVGSALYPTYNPLSGAAADVAVNVLVQCAGQSGPTRHCVSIGPGNYGDTTSRRMASGSNPLRYEFYRDAARTQKWGSYDSGYAGGTGRQFDVPATGSASAVLYVRILPNQQSTIPTPPNYDDTRSGNITSRYVFGTSANCPISGGTVLSGFTRVQAAAPANCLVSAGTLNFGTRDNLNAIVDATSTLFVQCTNTTPYTVTLNGGYTGDINARTMFANDQGIRYQLYRDAARSQVWGDTSADGVSGTGNAAETSLTVYGRVPVQATPTGATYTDMVVVTVTY